MTRLDPAADLPADWRNGLFLGRADFGVGPSPVLLADGRLFDMAAVAPTCGELVARRAFDPAKGRDAGSPSEAAFRLLPPVDLQCVKACGVTFAVSAVERVIEEAARGDTAAAAASRTRLAERVGAGLRDVRPGSDEAALLKAALIEDGLWSQYLEVAIGPDAEIFTKAPVLASVGHGDRIGIRSDSTWNNPEPEIALLLDPAGVPVGATLGNDVNLRDFEGRSALLLGKAKDNNASCALGPFVRLFDDGFTMDDVRAAEVTLRVEGTDGYVLDGVSTMREISRDPLELARQLFSEHQYPDGAVLFLGTLFAPVADREAPGRGFTHKPGDVVRIASARLGTLVNTVATSHDAPPWRDGIGALMRNLAARGLLDETRTRGEG